MHAMVACAMDPVTSMRNSDGSAIATSMRSNVLGFGSLHSGNVLVNSSNAAANALPPLREPIKTRVRAGAFDANEEVACGAGAATALRSAAVRCEQPAPNDSAQATSAARSHARGLRVFTEYEPDEPRLLTTGSG